VSALFLAGGLGLSAHDEWFTAVALVVTVVLAGATHLRWRGREVSAGSGVLVALAVGGSVWTWGSIAGADRPWIALAGLVVLAALVLAGFPVATKLRVSDAGVGTARDRSTFVGVEVGAGVAGFTLALVGVAAAPHLLQAGWVAAYLTLAGAAVSAMALVREERRHVAWPGGALLAMATWVRLWDVGVRVPEAYTLPSAVALGAVGLIHLRRRPGSSTMTALTPGLALALVPSLLWTFREPFEIRSVLLGAGCLALLLAGLRVNWTAPVVYAATAGILLVLRLAAPFVDAAVPRWVLIGVAGAVLIGMGVTWERRLQEARQLTGYVRELR
jgi:cell division protein FtsW (lipid II flippase)